MMMMRRRGSVSRNGINERIDASAEPFASGSCRYCIRAKSLSTLMSMSTCRIPVDGEDVFEEFDSEAGTEDGKEGKVTGPLSQRDSRRWRERGWGWMV